MEITAIRAERGRLWSMETRNCQKLLRYLLPPIGQYTQRLDNIACAGQLGALCCGYPAPLSPIALRGSLQLPFRVAAQYPRLL